MPSQRRRPAPRLTASLAIVAMLLVAHGAPGRRRPGTHDLDALSLDRDATRIERQVRRVGQCHRHGVGRPRCGVRAGWLDDDAARRRLRRAVGDRDTRQARHGDTGGRSAAGRGWRRVPDRAAGLRRRRYPRLADPPDGAGAGGHWHPTHRRLPVAEGRPRVGVHLHAHGHQQHTREPDVHVLARRPAGLDGDSVTDGRGKGGDSDDRGRRDEQRHGGGHATRHRGRGQLPHRRDRGSCERREPARSHSRPRSPARQRSRSARPTNASTCRAGPTTRSGCRW